MSAKSYGYSGCYTCLEIVPVDELNEIQVRPQYIDGSGGPAVPAFTCDLCEKTEEFFGLPSFDDDPATGGLTGLSGDELIALSQGPTS